LTEFRKNRAYGTSSYKHHEPAHDLDINNQWFGNRMSISLVPSFAPTLKFNFNYQGAVVSHHIGNMDEDFGGRDTTPMEVEEGSLLAGREQEVQDYESFHQ